MKHVIGAGGRRYLAPGLVAVALFASACSGGNEATTEAPPTTSGPTLDELFDEYSLDDDVGQPPPPGSPVIDQAIADGAAYLLDNTEEMTWADLLLVEYIAQRYEIPSLKGIADDATNLYEPTDYTKGLDRLIDPTAIAAPEDLQFDSINDLNWYTANALQCDVYGFPDDWLPRIRADLALPETTYLLTHIVIALQWSKELGCEFPESGEITPEILDRLRLAMDELPTAGDLSFEVLDMMSYLGLADEIDPRWIQLALDVQDESGGWRDIGVGFGDPETGINWHTTVLAVWLLAQYQGPDTGLPWLAVMPGTADLVAE